MLARCRVSPSTCVYAAVFWLHTLTVCTEATTPLTLLHWNCRTVNTYYLISLACGNRLSQTARLDDCCKHELSCPSSRRDIPSPPIKLAGIVLRRKEGKECSLHSHISLPYKQEDYEVLLRRWTKAPYTGQLCMLSGPMVQRSSPEATLLSEVQGWTAKLAARAEMKKPKGLKGTS